MTNKTTPTSRFVILVTGLPASGKTTLARQLGETLRLPLFSRDAVKEAIFECIEPGDSVSGKTLGAGSANVVWRLLQDCYSGAIVETWINPTRGDNVMVQAALKKAGVKTIYEILCNVSGDLAADRYASRLRSSVHRADEQVLKDIRHAGTLMKPLEFGPTLTVDTSKAVDLDEIIAWWSNISGNSKATK